MKSRIGFISNSSSSSFVIVMDVAYKKDDAFKETFKIITKLLCMGKVGKEEAAERWEDEKFGKDVEIWQFSIEYGSEENINTDCLKNLKYVKKTFDES